MSISESLQLAELYSQVTALLGTFFAWFPYWGPVFLGYLFWHQWIHFVQGQFLSKINWVMLEIKLPKETYKSPLAMEIVLGVLNQTNTGTWYDRWWKGKVKDFFSLEMVSLEGNIKFFIRTPWIYKNTIEAQLYGQYPDVEIYEVPDYVRYVDYRGKEGEWAIIAAEYGLTKEDPYPIKTYVDYGLDKDPKEEFKIDPLTAVIEYLGSMGKGEQLWLQIIVTGAGKRYHKADGTKGDWKDEGKAIIDKISKRTEKTKDGLPLNLRLTKGEQDVISAIERTMGKSGFDCGIRALYLVKKAQFHPGNIKSLGGLLKPFSTNNLNGFKPTEQTFGWDYPWQDYKDIRLNKKRKELFEAYKYRAWFTHPRHLKPFVLTSEELATIYHFPGGVAQTPTFGRITSRKSEAPVNLPI